MKHKWEWTGERCTLHSGGITKPHGSFEFICKGCNTTVWATGPPTTNGGRSQILHGLTDYQTTIESDCTNQMASEIMEEGWHIV